MEYRVGLGSFFATAAREMRLTGEYWDCECADAYLHHKSVSECPVCGAKRENQPDSFVKEVLDAGLPLEMGKCTCMDPVHPGDNPNCPIHGGK